MKLYKFFLVSFALSSLCYFGQAQDSRIEIIQPTVQQEATSIWRTINDITFLKNQGYQINLPKDPLIDSLITKATKGTFSNEDFSAIYALVDSKVFDEKKYTKAIQKVKNQKDLLNGLIDEIVHEKSNWDWDFKLFNTYKIVFTLYGTGGSYDPDEGIITLLTNAKGEFMKYKNPANTIIHEITHMGMEDAIVRKYNLSHGLKERMVDTFVYLMFSEKLPEYEIQAMGNEDIDRYVKEKKDLGSLNKILAEFLMK